MTTARRLAVLLSVAAPLALVGCNDTCPTEQAELAKVAGQPGTLQPGAVPACSGMAANTTVSVSLKVCPACNQTAPSCAVDIVPGSGEIQLDPVVQVCESPGSCNAGCLLGGLTCTFQTPGPGDYMIIVFDPVVGVVTRPFQVIGTGGDDTCSG